MFLDLEFKDYVIPTKIEILETYNPGAVVRILALLPGNSNSNQRSDKKRLVTAEDNQENEYSMCQKYRTK